MDTLRRMRLFTRVADLGSFRRAADQLGAPVATVSMAVQALEKQLGVRLLQRTTRKVTLTSEGAAYRDRCTRLLEEVDELESFFSATGARPRGTVRVDLPERLARLEIIPRLASFLDAYPDIQVRLSATDRLVDPVGESIDRWPACGPRSCSSPTALAPR